MGSWVHRLSEVDLVGKRAVCANCGPVDVKVKPRSGKQVGICMTRFREERRRERSPGRSRHEYRRRRRITNPNHFLDRPWPEGHGLTITEAQAYRQGKCCAICGSTEKLNVDHDHTTGEIRGVLCTRHNLQLGLRHDSIEEIQASIKEMQASIAEMQAMIRYLEEAAPAVVSVER